MNISRYLYSFNTFLHLKKLNAVDLFDEKKLKQIQYFKLRKLLIHAYGKFPFYRERMDAAAFDPYTFKSLEEIRKIPILTKQEYRELVAIFEKEQGGKIGQFIADKTSGSTGLPLVLYRNWKEKTINTARFIRPFFINGMSIKDKTLGIVSSSRVTSNDSVIQRMGFMRRKTIRKESTNGDIIEELQRFKPDVLYANTSNLALTALYAKEHNLKIPHPKFYFSVAEALEPGSVALVKEVYGENLLNHYGSIELGTIAFQTIEHPEFLQICHDTHVLEVIDKDGNHVDNGKAIITDLDAYSLPMIRYQLGDDIETDTYNNIRVIKKINGRSENFLYLKDGSKRSFNLFTEALWQFESIAQFKVIQTAFGKLDIQLVFNNNNGNSYQFEKIEQGLENIYGQPFDINFEILPFIKPNSNGKVIRFVSSIKSV